MSDTGRTDRFPTSGQSDNVPHSINNSAALQYDEGKRISLFDVALIAVRNRRLIAYTVALFGIIGFVVAIIPEEPKYQSSAVVIRESTGNTSSGSLSMLGRIGMPRGEGLTGISAHIYPDVLRSREVRLAVVRDTFYVSQQDTIIVLTDYLDEPSSGWDRFLNRVQRYTLRLPATIRHFLATEDAKSPPSGANIESSLAGSATTPVSTQVSGREESAMSSLRRMVSVYVDEDTGLMHVVATAPDPHLSAALVSSLIDHLERRVREMRTVKSERNLEFVERRFQEVEAELQAAEEELAIFEDRNSSFQSARLRTDRERLQRKVALKSELYGSLQAEVTQAQIERQRSEPVITILEQPALPRGPISSDPTFGFLLSLVFGLLAGCALAFGRYVVELQAEDEEESEKLNELRRTLSNGKGGVLSRLWRSAKMKESEHSEKTKHVD